MNKLVDMISSPIFGILLFAPVMLFFLAKGCAEMEFKAPAPRRG